MKISFTGWKAGSKDELIPTDIKCSIKLKLYDFSSNSPSLRLYNNPDTLLGSITMDTSNEKAPKIVVLSNVECKNGEKQCTKEFALDLQAEDLKNLECKLIFAASSWMDQDTQTSIICNSDETALTDDNGILSVIDRVKYTKLIGIGSYNFHCPLPGNLE